MKFPLQCFLKIITGTTGLFTAPDSVQGGSGVVTCMAPAGEKPELVKTHLRNMIIVPEMTGSVAGVYNGNTFNQIEIKPEMIDHYLAEFSISYKPVKHGRPGIGATHSSRFIPLK
ncbi:putative ribosomal protein S19/S15 [Helianthus annuus]|uniref:Ribosomal protein S19/S15 n=1 Tax=Helianthus annuus TaxID=4232 RepID=A0A9K3NY04_HELAN|nr:putative ribosomal protein S19/S15 [Helianthus annuus]KAJ0594908.1 putative ribosomal protein S19/S15 [Helianthus annuus]KAJ0603243.1 putative ribosomal protein S19/S15 [Helianthus annuus]KAJ0609952.1 putative ribosomal protein S19/S15 [Helianthus annuus]KAJ0775737.1 putative ribosomal protein S19/S15 [Helianthus annuus]